MAEQSTLRYIIEFDARYAKQLDSTLKNVGKSVKQLDGGMRRVSTTTKTLGQNFSRLAGRALMVIPVWLALRNTWLAFVNSIREGLKHMRELDKAMARVIAVSHGIQDVENFARGLKNEIRALSISTGESVDKIAEAYYRFGTAGIVASGAVDGMKLAVKTSIAIMGDSTQTARTMADVYNLMKENMKDVTNTQEAMQKIASTMAVLWTNNAFELNEFNAALRTVTGVAKNFDLTLDELLPALATAHTLMQRGGTAGSQLARSFMMMTRHITRVNKVLGRTVDLSSERIFDVFLEILKKINREYADGGQKAKALFDIFGMKGVKVVGSFAANFEKLINELERFKDMPLKERMETLNRLFELQMNTIDRQLKRFRELRQVSFEMFAISITGADNFVDALKRVNDFMETHIIPTAVSLGIVLRRSFESVRDIIDAISKLSQGKIGEALPELLTTPSSQKRQEMFDRFREQQEGTISRPGKAFSQAVRKFETGILKPFEKAREANDIITMMDILINKLGFAEKEAVRLLDPVSELTFVLWKAKQGVSTFQEGMTKSKEETKELVTELERAQLQMEVIQNSVKNQVQNLELMKIYGASDIQVQKAKLEYMLQHVDELTNERELEKQILAYNKAINDEIIKSAALLQGAFKDALSGFLKEEISFKDMFKQYADAFRNALIDAFAEGITGALGGTGIFAEGGILLAGIKETFGGVQGKIQGAFYRGGTYVNSQILNAFTQGGQIAASQIRGAMVGGSNIAEGDFGAGLAQSVAGAGGGGAGASPTGTRLGAWLSQPLIKPKTGKGGKATPGLSRGQAGVIGVQSALLGYSQYQSAKAGGISGGQAALSGIASGLGSALFGGGLAAAGTGGLAAMGPVGWVGLGLMGIGMALGLFGGKDSKQTTVSSRTSETQVASKIDVSNEKLELINRNLVALRASMETYILPRSAYFSEKRNIEDEFSLHARRGL